MTISRVKPRAKQDMAQDNIEMSRSAFHSLRSREFKENLSLSALEHRSGSTNLVAPTRHRKSSFSGGRTNQRQQQYSERFTIDPDKHGLCFLQASLYDKNCSALNQLSHDLAQ